MDDNLQKVNKYRIANLTNKSTDMSTENTLT